MDGRLPSKTRWSRHEEIYQLAAKGLKPTEIGRQLGVSRSTVYRDLEHAGEEVRRFFTEMPEESRNAILLHMLDLDEHLQGQLAHLKALQDTYIDLLFDDGPPPRINGDVHRALMEISHEILELLKIYAVLVGRHIPQASKESPKAHRPGLRVIYGHGAG